MIRNNIAYDSRTNSVVFCSGKFVQVISCKRRTMTGTENIFTEKYAIRAKWIRPGSKAYLAVLAGDRLCLWDDRKRTLVFSTNADDVTISKENYFRGVTSVSGKILVGTSTGLVVGLEPSPSASRGEVSFESCLNRNTDGTAISCMCTDPRVIDKKRAAFAAGNVSGNISVFSGKELAAECTFACARGRRSPCMSLAMRGAHVFAGFASGHVRIFSRKSRSMIVEICAHARSLTGLALHPSRDMLASVGEDTVLNVWTFSEKGEVDLKFSEAIEDALLTGVAFRGREIVATAYDRDAVLVFERGGK